MFKVVQKTATKTSKTERITGVILLIAIGLALFYISNLSLPEKNQSQPIEQVIETQKPEPPQVQTQPVEQEQQIEQEKILTFRVDFKYPNGTNYGTYNTDDISDDVFLVPNNFAEKRRTAYLNIHPNNYGNYPQELLRVPDELVKSIDKRIQAIDTSDPEAILKVAKVVQEEVLAFGPRYLELFPDSYFNCVPRSIYIYAMLGKISEEIGLNAQIGLHEAAMYSTSNTIDHQDVWLYDGNQLYIIYTTDIPSGISKWEDNFLHQHKGYVGGLEYEKMKTRFGPAMAKRSLLFSLISALDIEAVDMVEYVTMTESDAKYWSHQFITNGLDKELSEEMWKIFSSLESPTFQESNFTPDGNIFVWILSGKKGLVILEDSYLVTEDKEYWLETACEGDPDEIARVKREGRP